MRIAILSVMALASVVATSLAVAEPGKRRPPPEAIDACEELRADDVCSFKGRGGESVDGVCFTPEPSKPLACKPDNPPPRGEDGNRPDDKERQKDRGDEAEAE